MRVLPKVVVGASQTASLLGVPRAVECMTDDYAALREAAEKATKGVKGPWKSNYNDGRFANRAAVEDYIAAASPDVVLGLLDRLEFLESERSQDLEGFMRLQQQLRSRENRIAELEATQAPGAYEPRMSMLQRDRIEQLEKDNAALREMLTKHAVVPDVATAYSKCRECEKRWPDEHPPKHSEDCSLAALLETSA